MIMAMLNDQGYDSPAGDDHCCDRIDWWEIFT